MSTARDYEMVPLETVTATPTTAGNYRVEIDFFVLLDDEDRVGFYGGYGHHMRGGNIVAANPNKAIIEARQRSVLWAVRYKLVPVLFIPLVISDFAER